MSILITGGAGYIGSSVVRALLTAGESIVVLDDLSSDVRASRTSQVTFVTGDCSDQALVGPLLDKHGITSIIHLAGSGVVFDSVNDPASCYANNTAATRGLVELAAKRDVGHFILCSSAAVYGDAGLGALPEDTAPQPISPYGRSMMMSEMILQDVAMACDLRYVILRGFNAAGVDPEGLGGGALAHPSTLLRCAISVALRNVPALDVYSAPQHTPDGTPLRDYVHVADLARAHVAALRYLRAGGASRTFNCGTGRGHSVLDVVHAIETHSGATVPVRRLAPRRGDPAALIADTTRIRKELGWAPVFEDLGAIVSQALTATYRQAPAQTMMPAIVRLVAESGVPAATLKNLIARLAPARRLEAPAMPAPAAAADAEDVSADTRESQPTKKLTIGMATYDDYDGVYFTLQAIRLYHPEILPDVEFVIIDNNPGGPCGTAVRKLAESIPDCRYLPQGHIKATTIKDWVFRRARGQFVLCVDCHILIAPGALKRLMDYFDAAPDTKDLLHGPLIFDGMDGYATHFKPEWSGGMYGTWGTDPAGADPDLPPFEIPMQGMGLFACRRDAWAGFNPDFRGFGGEEGYIHEKFRQRGGKVLCLPFLRWMHRFNRPMGLPYPNVWADRVRNYLIGFREVGWDTQPVIEHFRTLLGDQVWASVSDALGPSLLQPETSTGATPHAAPTSAASRAEPAA